VDISGLDLTTPAFTWVDTVRRVRQSVDEVQTGFDELDVSIRVLQI
jgi:hypothetical protein